MYTRYGHPTHPTIHTTDQHSTQDRALKHINALMAQPTLLSDDIKCLTVFSAIINTTTALTATQDNSNNQKIFNFLGWAGLSLCKEANFHHFTQGIWPPILPEKTQHKFVAGHGLHHQILLLHSNATPTSPATPWHPNPIPNIKNPVWLF